MENQVILQRKQPTPFKVYYPETSNGRPIEYTWIGTTSKNINERPVPWEVFMWLKSYTRTFELGMLQIKETEDEIIVSEKENIADIENAEKSALTKDQVKDILEKGNHNTLKSALKSLTDDKSDILKKEIIKQVTAIATDIGIDSSAKRKIFCEWAGIDFENSDIIFDKNVEALHQ
jgi:hypothetical protein